MKYLVAALLMLTIAGCKAKQRILPQQPVHVENLPQQVQSTPINAPAAAVPQQFTYGPYRERISFDPATIYGESGTSVLPVLRAPITVYFAMCKRQPAGDYLWSFMLRNYSGKPWTGKLHVGVMSDNSEIFGEDVVSDSPLDPATNEAPDIGRFIQQFRTSTAPVSMGGNIVGYTYTVVSDTQTPEYIVTNPPRERSEQPEQNQPSRVFGSAPAPIAPQVQINDYPQRQPPASPTAQPQTWRPYNPQDYPSMRLPGGGYGIDPSEYKHYPSSPPSGRGSYGR